MSIDQRTIESAIEQYYREIYWFCFSRLINKDIVEDVVQNVFVTLQEKSGGLTADNLRAWLYSVAQKKVLEARRDEVIRSRFVSYDVEMVAKSPSLVYEIVEDHLDDPLDGKETDAVKQRILQMLTPAERELFEAVYEKRIKRKELAEQLNITENALNVRVYRMKAHIKEYIRVVMMAALFVFVKCR